MPILGAWPVVTRLGPEICRDLDAALRREWLVTNGLGGYASGTLAGIATRRYHGPLVAARTPPVGRTVLVGALVEWLVVDGERVALHAHEYADGTIDQHGYRHLAAFELELGLPAWTYHALGVRLEKRLWMPYEANMTLVRYTLLDDAAGREVAIEVTPLVTERDHHDLALPADPPRVDAIPDGVAVAWGEGSTTLLTMAGATVEPRDDRYRDIRHREEAARGLDHRSDLHAPATFRATLGHGDPATLVLDGEVGPIGETAPPRPDPQASLAAERDRRASLMARAGLDAASEPALAELVVAADQFLVRRSIPDPEGGPPIDGRSVIAGYPWFNDWGRDTMIALSGLTLATGRADEGATILRSFARFARDGLLPNNFPDRADEIPEYHTADAPLWYPIALHRHVVATGDETLVDELLPTMRAILDRHVTGTRFGIGMDPADGLLRAGAEGYQLTWMDAKVDDWVVTPRRGKPVEIQALWANALRLVSDWLLARGDPEEVGAVYRALADRAALSFRRRFWRPDLGYLLDVVDGPDGDEPALRPNQLFAISLPHPLIDGDEAAAVVAACRSALATAVGLRSLAPTDPAYRRSFQGDRWTRDGAYHQGTIWSWLLGPYAEAVARTTGDPAAGLTTLRPVLDHLADAGLGSISEIFEPEPPFLPRGCIAQAWSVAEVLRVWRDLAPWSGAARVEAPRTATGSPVSPGTG